MASPENEAAVRAAMAQAMADAQRRQDYYQQRAGLGVPAGTSGPEGNAPLTLPQDRAITGTHHAGGA